MVMFVYAYLRIMVQLGAQVSHLHLFSLGAPQVLHPHLPFVKTAPFTHTLSPPQHLYPLHQAAILFSVFQVSAHLFEFVLATQVLLGFLLLLLRCPSLQAIPYSLAQPVFPNPSALPICHLYVHSPMHLPVHLPVCHGPPL